MALALGELGRIALQQGEHERAEELCDNALVVASETGDARRSGSSITWPTSTRPAVTTRERAGQEEALRLRQMLDDPTLVMNSTCKFRIGAWENDRSRAPVSVREDARPRERPRGRHPHRSRRFLAELHLSAGDVDEAEQRIRGPGRRHGAPERPQPSGVRCSSAGRSRPWQRRGRRTSFRGRLPAARRPTPQPIQWPLPSATTRD